jgi:hypothetical protein
MDARTIAAVMVPIALMLKSIETGGGHVRAME